MLLGGGVALGVMGILKFVVGVVGVVIGCVSVIGSVMLSGVKSVSGVNCVSSEGFVPPSFLILGRLCSLKLPMLSGCVAGVAGVLGVIVSFVGAAGLVTLYMSVLGLKVVVSFGLLGVEKPYKPIPDAFGRVASCPACATKVGAG